MYSGTFLIAYTLSYDLVPRPQKPNFEKQKLKAVTREAGTGGILNIFDFSSKYSFGSRQVGYSSMDCFHEKQYKRK